MKYTAENGIQGWKSDDRIAFILPIAPKSTQFGKRVMIRGGKPVFFNDAKKESYQSIISLLAVEFRPPSPWECALEMTLTFALPRPKSRMRKSDPDGTVWATTRPDWDNIAKGSQDALSRCGFWRDDSQIARSVVNKVWHEKNGAPRIEVEIKKL